MQNKKEFWHFSITDKSFEFLKELRFEVKELGLNKKQFADFKKGIIVNL